MEIKWKCKYIALDMYNGELVILSTNRLYKVG